MEAAVTAPIQIDASCFCKEQNCSGLRGSEACFQIFRSRSSIWENATHLNNLNRGSFMSLTEDGPEVKKMKAKNFSY